jgi:hypothetical protein
MEEVVGDSRVLLPPGFALKVLQAVAGGEKIHQFIQDFTERAFQFVLVCETGTATDDGAKVRSEGGAVEKPAQPLFRCEFVYITRAAPGATQEDAMKTENKPAGRGPAPEIVTRAAADETKPEEKATAGDLSKFARAAGLPEDASEERVLGVIEELREAKDTTQRRLDALEAREKEREKETTEDLFQRWIVDESRARSYATEDDPGGHKKARQILEKRGLEVSKDVFGSVTAANKSRVAEMPLARGGRSLTAVAGARGAETNDEVEEALAGDDNGQAAHERAMQLIRERKLDVKKDYERVLNEVLRGAA